MDEDFVDITESNSKTILFVLFLIIVALLIMGYIFVYRPHHFGLKTINLEVGSVLKEDVNDYLKEAVVDESLYKLDLSKVKTDEVGTYEYTVTINNNKQIGKINVIDTKAPEFSIKEKLQIEVNDEDFFIGDTLESCTDYSLPCLVTYKNEKDADFINKTGIYTFTIVISDIYKNKKEATVTIEVLEKGKIVREEEKDLEFSKSSTEIPGFKNQYYIKLDKALKPDSEAAESTASEISAEEIETFVKTNYPNNEIKNTEIVSMYNKSGYIIGFVVKITLNNDLVVYMPSEQN